MTTPTDPKRTLAAVERAYRWIAHYNGGDRDAAFEAWHESQRDGTTREFALCCAIIAADAKKERLGDRAQLDLDGMALDSAEFRDRELALLEERDNDVTVLVPINRPGVSVTAALHDLRSAVINYVAHQSGYVFDPRALSCEDVDAIGEVMVNDDGLDLSAVKLTATLRATTEDSE